MEVDRNPELSPEWQTLIKEALEGSLDNYELFGQVINVTPFTLTEEQDVRDFMELTPQEQEFIKQTLFQSLQFNPNQTEVVNSYEYEIPKSENPNKPDVRSGKVRVNVYKTGRSDEDMYLHEATLEDGQQDYVVAPQDYQP